MPYAATPTLDIAAAGALVRLQLSEVDVAAADEATIAGQIAGSGGARPSLPVVGRLRRVKARLTGGAGATIDPILMLAAAGTTVPNVIWENGTPAASIDIQWDRESAPIFYRGTALYWRARPDAGANNTVSSELLIEPGW